MKRLQQFIVLTSVFVLAAVHNPVSIPAQTAISIRGGVSRATMSGVPVEGAVNLDPRIGLSLGASATIPMQDNFGLRLDGGYVQKGFSSKQGAFEANFSLDYVELSGAGVVSLTSSESPASVYALAGPSLGFNTKCEASDRVSGIEGIEGFEDLDGGSASESCGDDVSGIDLGITAGIGADMAISEGMTFSVNLRYTLGLTNVDKSGEDDVKNRSLTLQAGVGFPIGE